MRKQLLLAFAFFAVICGASAQSNTFTFTGTSSDSENFSFGSSAGIYALSGTEFSQGNSFISYNSEVASGSPVSESFGINTSGSTIDATLTFAYRKRAAMTGVITISIPGQSDVTYTLPDTSADDGGTDNLVEKTLEYTTTLSLSPTTTNITITVDELAQNAANNVRLRVYDVTVNGTLSASDFETPETSVKLYPNPVKNSFQLDSNNNIESVELYNITGQLVKTYKEASTYYDISDLTNGIYLATINTEFGTKTFKVLKE
ncbi:T9SS type A sorting domain-containing protein [Winogradskyella eckloniae]|uniref:T9SS type A sorting domain-containing protein n=1 Tax=Winogradskyella eckloniae TaxID=1089306 RepID=UPI001563F2AB|nr:T9SS type A sorting domain-containing protein [Winogradskyella eckloniae]NRD20684.1 T9SS type A sorting domain-containing protein [Winogradskyella eckloniae]